MKNTVTKVISIIMVLILLLTAFAGCGDAMYEDKETTPSVNLGAEPDEPNEPDGDDGEKEIDPTRVFTLDSLEPLSKEKQEEVEAAWKEKKGYDLLWRETVLANGKVTSEDRYYGTFNGGVVIFHPIADNLTVGGSMEIGGQKIKFGKMFEIWIYKNNDFIEIKEAYESGLLSDDNVMAIVEYHNEFV